MKFSEIRSEWGEVRIGKTQEQLKFNKYHIWTQKDEYELHVRVTGRQLAWQEPRGKFKWGKMLRCRHSDIIYRVLKVGWCVWALTTSSHMVTKWVFKKKVVLNSFVLIVMKSSLSILSGGKKVSWKIYLVQFSKGHWNWRLYILETQQRKGLMSWLYVKF